jgi:metal-sulfur cluster biosynthetic enzyme
MTTAVETAYVGAELRERILDALATVYDPELDEPITALGFVDGCRVGARGGVEVRLRLPTPQCAPNFAFLMVADARDAVRRVPGVRDVSVVLEDHYTGAEINRAAARGGGFTTAFPGETEDDRLERLRELFQRKALIARQGRIIRRLLEAGLDGGAVCALRMDELPESAEVMRCLELRAALGIASAGDSPGFVLGGGEPLTTPALERWLRMARLIQTSLEANGGICRSLLGARRQLAENAKEVV